MLLYLSRYNFAAPDAADSRPFFHHHVAPPVASIASLLCYLIYFTTWVSHRMSNKMRLKMSRRIAPFSNRYVWPRRRCERIQVDGFVVKELLCTYKAVASKYNMSCVACHRISIHTRLT